MSDATAFEPPAEDIRDPDARVIAPVIVSTRAAEGIYEDASANIITQYGTEAGFIVRPPVIIPDGKAVLAVLTELLTQVEPAVIITSGGTGLSPDDMTPEFTAPLLDKEIPGIMEAIREYGRTKTPFAALSRGLAGISGQTAVINLPGSPKAVQDGMEVLSTLLPHLCDQVTGKRSGHPAPTQPRQHFTSQPSAGRPPMPAESDRVYGDDVQPGGNAQVAYKDEPGTVVHASVNDTAIDPAQAEAEVSSEYYGAVVSFSGIVRNHDGGKDVDKLSYSHHPTAEDLVLTLAQQVAERHPRTRLWISHRIGELAIGDYALVASAASAHRAEAFAACLDLVETIKYQLPIWKEQFFSDGNVEWVGIGEDETPQP